MVKDKDGYWSVTTPPVVPGFHHYSFIIDGAVVRDPASDGGIEVPEAGVDFDLPKDVPHGELRERWYKSEITGATRAYLRIHAAGLRHQSQGALPRSLPTARRGRERDHLEQVGITPTSSWTT